MSPVFTDRLTCKQESRKKDAGKPTVIKAGVTREQYRFDVKRPFRQVQPENRLQQRSRSQAAPGRGANAGSRKVTAATSGFIRGRAV
ncbi:hypothetical protein CG430_22655 [Pantoea ananatis]|nr:hypothetical protein CG430_22655 [Pantoea ananatis]